MTTTDRRRLTPLRFGDRFLVTFVAGALAAACSSASTAPADAGLLDARTDGSEQDGARPLADTGVGPDVATTSVDAPDATWDPCAPASVIDLAAAGTRMNGTTRYSGTTAGAGPGAQLRLCSSPGWEVALRYVPATRTRLRVSTANPGTTAAFDTVVGVLRSCDAAGGSVPLVCGDDFGAGDRPWATTVLTPAIDPVSGPVWIVVAGFVPAQPQRLGQGAFELSVTELPEVAVGGTCDPTGLTNGCAPGLQCDPRGDGLTGVCVAPGAAGGACRSSGSPCDAALECVGTGASARCRAAGAPGGRCLADGSCGAGLACGGLLGDRRCVRTVAVGGSCDVIAETDHCVQGASCVDLGDGAGSRCVVDGARDSACRATGQRCDPGLGCSSGPPARCRPLAAAGAACDPSEYASVCADGSSCVGTATTAPSCVVDGRAGGHCIHPPAWDFYSNGLCYAGLACTGSGTCQPARALGAVCDPAERRDGCVQGTACTASGNTTVCTPIGSLGSRCRVGSWWGTASGGGCDDGLACGRDGRCHHTVPAGGRCDVADSPRNACEVGSSCVGHGATGTCVPDGTDSGACRASNTPCAVGLTCGTAQRCRPTVRLRQPCDPTGQASACEDGTTCVTTSGGVPTCHALGSIDAACRSSIPACDAGLACGWGACRRAAAPNDPCDPAVVASACVDGYQCLVGASGPRCVHAGVEGTSCYGQCADGLACSSSQTCRSAVADGDPCDPSGIANACASGVCNAGAASPRCLPQGSLGGACRGGSQSCDAGFACDGAYGGHCRMAVRVGDRCDVTGIHDACAAGSSCVFDGTQATCVAAGAAGGPCRSLAPRCDAGLACTVPTGTTGQCRPAVPVGGVCDPFGQTSACVPRSQCMSSGADFRCVADRSLGGACVNSACAVGLACSQEFHCRTAVRLGSSCDRAGVLNACGDGASCVGVGPEGTCMLRGANLAPCRFSDHPCDAGLVCTAGVCRSAVAVGGACDPTGLVNGCTLDSTCVGVGGVATCVANGAFGATCRFMSPACDAGLACATTAWGPRCRPAVAVGEACDVGGIADACADGATCASDRGVCVADGANGGACRTSGGDACDAGLACTSSYAGHCRRAVPAGGVCDPYGLTSACMGDDQCVFGLCRAPGTVGGSCRSTSPACDTGLGCSLEYSCVPSRAVGATCDGSGTSDACVDGSACLVGAAGTHCVADGTAGGRCRGTGVPCNAGLACGAYVGDGAGGRCLPAVASGAPCDPAGLVNACAPPALCVSAASGGASTCQPPPYVFSDDPTAAFVDACATGRSLRAGLSGLDDGHPATALSLPFAFPFYGTSYSSARPSTNGYLVFGSTAPIDAYSGTLPRSDEVALAAPYFVDVLLGSTSDLCVATVGAAPSRRFVVEWSDVGLIAEPTAHLTFEVVLEETTHAIGFVYARLERTDTSAAVATGLQDTLGARPLLWTTDLTVPGGVRATPR